MGRLDDAGRSGCVMAKGYDGWAVRNVGFFLVEVWFDGTLIDPLQYVYIYILRETRKSSTAALL
jgi:hypothetical protein